MANKLIILIMSDLCIIGAVYMYVCLCTFTYSKSKSEVSLILRQAGCLEGPLLFHLYLTGQVFFYWER